MSGNLDPSVIRARRRLDLMRQRLELEIKRGSNLRHILVLPAGFTVEPGPFDPQVLSTRTHAPRHHRGVFAKARPRCQLPPQSLWPSTVEALAIQAQQSDSSCENPRLLPAARVHLFFGRERDAERLQEIASAISPSLNGTPQATSSES